MVGYSVNHRVEPETVTLSFMAAAAALSTRSNNSGDRPYGKSPQIMTFPNVWQPRSCQLADLAGDRDAYAVAMMEMRLDSEGGWDTRNEDTFGPMPHQLPLHQESLGDGQAIAGPRRPYRWWRSRACLDENNVWGRRMVPWEVRVSQGETEAGVENYTGKLSACPCQAAWEQVLEVQRRQRDFCRQLQIETRQKAGAELAAAQWSRGASEVVCIQEAVRLDAARRIAAAAPSPLHPFPESTSQEAAVGVAGEDRWLASIFAGGASGGGFHT